MIRILKNKIKAKRFKNNDEYFNFINDDKIITHIVMTDSNKYIKILYSFKDDKMIEEDLK